MDGDTAMRRGIGIAMMWAFAASLLALDVSEFGWKNAVAGMGFSLGLLTYLGLALFLIFTDREP